jgi:hypothetical protein
LREAGAGKEGEAAISNGDMAMQPDAACASRGQPNADGLSG